MRATVVRCAVLLLSLADIAAASAQGFPPAPGLPSQGQGNAPNAFGAPAPDPQAPSQPGMAPPGFSGQPSVGFGPQPGQNGQPSRPNLADELTDFGVPPQSTLQPNVGTPTPLTIPGGHVITTNEVRQAIGSDIVLVDVWDFGGPHPSLPGAIPMPGAGSGGTFDDSTQQRLWTALAQATNRQPQRPIVFFCTGSRCWESYNAALRAINMGFQTVLWYRGGLAAWAAAASGGPGPAGPGPVQGPPNAPPRGQGRIGFGN